jgi:hypothetical protein
MSYNPTRFHQDGFGGYKNIAHPAGARAHRELSSKEIVIPKSAVKHAIPSLGEQNIRNLHGHYVHDEHHSPFASFLYYRSKEDLEKEQQEFVEKMKHVRNQYGAWDFHDTQNVRPIANFDKVEYKDMMNDDFPDGSWQKDETYVRNLISEGVKLVKRVKFAIYAEYGHPILGLSEEKVKEVENMFAVYIGDSPPSDFAGIAYITQKGFDMLVRKLLHAMITNDEFYCKYYTMFCYILINYRLFVDNMYDFFFVLQIFWEDIQRQLDMAIIFNNSILCNLQTFLNQYFRSLEFALLQEIWQWADLVRLTFLWDHLLYTVKKIL